MRPATNKEILNICDNIFIKYPDNYFDFYQHVHFEISSIDEFDNNMNPDELENIIKPYYFNLIHEKFSQLAEYLRDFDYDYKENVKVGFDKEKNSIILYDKNNNILNEILINNE